MKLIFKVHKNTAYEIEMGHKVGFTIPWDVDAISLSANSNGFTQFTAAMRALYRDSKEFEQSLINCKKFDTVIEARPESPTIILVPPTRGKTGKSQSFEYYATEIISVCNYRKRKILHFAHYGFINGDFQWMEIRRTMEVFLNPLNYTTLEKMYFEIDSRYFNEVFGICKDVAKMYRLIKPQFGKIDSPEFEYKTVRVNEDGTSWAELVRKDA
jgi:hypothetical protein